MKRLALFTILALTGLLCAVARAQQQETFYVFHPLEGTLGESGEDIGFEMGGQSCAYAINNDGVVVGSAEGYAWNSQLGQQNSYTSEMPVVWSTPDYSEPIGGAGDGSRAVDINDDGKIVSQYLGGSWGEGFDNAWYGGLYYHTSTGTVRLGVTAPDGSFAVPMAINQAGQVVANGLHGEYEETSHLLTEGDPVWSYQSLPSEKTYSVNDQGDTVGTKWVDLWNEDTNIYLSQHGYINSTDIGSLWDPAPVSPGRQVPQAMTTPYDVNNQDVVVGESTVSEDCGHAFVWQSGQGMSDLGTLGGSESEAHAVNELNMVVGQSTTADGDTHAFVYHNLVGMVDLNAVISADARDGLVLESANDVNDNGAIVGKARDLTTGMRKGFLLTPAAYLSGATASGDFEPDGFEAGNYDQAGLGDTVESLGATLHLDNFTMLGDFATLSVAYDEAALQSLGLSEQDIRLFWYDPNAQQWVLAGAQSNNLPGGSFVLGSPTNNHGDFGVDTEANLVWVNIDHASTYGLFAVPEPTTLGLLALGCLAIRRPRR